jgi:hypothetical protein
MPKNTLAYFVFLLLAAFLHLSTTCKPQKLKQAEKITIGSGGGFTGQTKEYIINKDGSILLKQGDKEAKGFGKISKKDWRELTKKTEESGLQTLDLNDPGNFYYYIQITVKDKNHKVTWNNQSGEPGKKMQALYNYMMELVLKSKTTN